MSTTLVDRRKVKIALTDEQRRSWERERDREYKARRRAEFAAQGLTSTGASPKIRLRGLGWTEILEDAASIVDSYGTNVTLRQLFYRLVSKGSLRNTVNDYGQLSSRTAEARRQGTFPSLLDRTSEIVRHRFWESPRELLEQARRQYRRDRTEGQEHQVWVVIEKAGLLEQLRTWFGDERGLPMAALSGYASQTDVDDIHDAVDSDGRPAVLLYGGDFDPSGEDIFRDFTERTDCWDDEIRVVLTAEQVERYQLPEYPGKRSDARAGRFVARHGRLVQVEMDALDPNDLRDLFTTALDSYFDQSAFVSVMERERVERDSMGAAS
jgi:hypothetical protein